MCIYHVEVLLLSTSISVMDSKIKTKCELNDFSWNPIAEEFKGRMETSGYQPFERLENQKVFIVNVIALLIQSNMEYRRTK